MKLELERSDIEAIADLVAERVLSAITGRLDSQQEADGPMLFSERAAASKLGISRWTLKRLRDEGKISGRQRKDRGKVMYTREDLKKAVAALGGDKQ